MIDPAIAILFVGFLLFAVVVYFGFSSHYKPPEPQCATSDDPAPDDYVTLGGEHLDEPPLK